MSELSLKSLLVPSKAVEAEFPGLDGFKVNLAFLSREALINIRKKATKVSYKNRQPVEELDDKVFLKNYVETAIKGWSGLKLKYLDQLAPVDLTGQDLDAELEFTNENALFLMQNSAEFDAFVSETVTDLSSFTNCNKRA